MHAGGRSSVVAEPRETTAHPKTPVRNRTRHLKVQIKQLGADLAAAHGEIHRLCSTAREADLIICRAATDCRAERRGGHT